MHLLWSWHAPRGWQRGASSSHRLKIILRLQPWHHHVRAAGGFEDDRDEGEWLLYTGSGGKDLSGNKRTNKVQCADQVFEGGNQALVQSCIDGLPVRVLRSHKEIGSCYAPSKADPLQSIRYDGIYKIVAAWRSVGQQGALPWPYSVAAPFFSDCASFCCLVWSSMCSHCLHNLRT
jgi:E3 ubiquitin-protein ligase UHRF1